MSALGELRIVLPCDRCGRHLTAVRGCHGCIIEARKVWPFAMPLASEMGGE